MRGFSLKWKRADNEKRAARRGKPDGSVTDNDLTRWGGDEGAVGMRKELGVLRTGGSAVKTSRSLSNHRSRVEGSKPYWVPSLSNCPPNTRAYQLEQLDRNYLQWEYYHCISTAKLWS